ncbi:MAG TPA: hypothetical protein VJ255_00140, partial [Candidatus Acidoferrum sp.]|nr:hypothetical protein [Candidatus Acidoferrum sp.]
MRSFGVIFDGEQNRARLKSLEQRTSDPNFWSNPEEAQTVLRERKRVEGQIAADEKLASLASDIETYIE